MTETTGTTPAPDEATPQRSRRRRMVLAAAGLAIVALIVRIAAFAVTRDDDDPQPSATEQIAAAQHACQQSLDSDRAPNGPGPGPGWCDDMAGWMSTHMSDGRMMMGRGMWTSPEAMRDACTRAMGNTPAATGDPTEWCDQMVDWMTRHEGDWDHWHHTWDD